MGILPLLQVLSFQMENPIEDAMDNLQSGLYTGDYRGCHVGIPHYLVSPLLGLG